MDPPVEAKVTVAAPALLFIAVEIAFSMNCPSGFWLEVEIEWLRLVCVDRRHCGRQGPVAHTHTHIHTLG